MREINNSFSPSFGVQDSLEIGSGDTNLLRNLFDNEDEIIDPKDVEKITPESPAPGSENPKPKIKEEGDGKEFEDIGSPLTGEALIKNLFDSDDEEEEEEEEGSVIDTLKPSKKEKEIEEDESSKETIFSTFSKDLFKIGVFSKDEDEGDVNISTPQEFLARFNIEKEKGAYQVLDDIISKYGEDYQHAFEAIYVKGVHPKQYFNSYNQIVDYANLDMTKEENQVLVVKRMLSDQDFEQDDIDSEIERLRNYGDLETISAKYHKSIIKKDVVKLKNLEQEAEREKAKQEQIKQQYVQNVKSVIQEKLKTKYFDGIPLSQSMANKLHDFLLVDKYKNKNGELMTDFDVAMLQLKKPENHLLKVKVGLLLKTLEEDPNLSSIQKTGITKQTDSLFSEVARLGKKKEINKTEISNLSNNSFIKNL